MFCIHSICHNTLLAHDNKYIPPQQATTQQISIDEIAYWQEEKEFNGIELHKH